MSKEVQYGTDKKPFFDIGNDDWERIKDEFSSCGGAEVLEVKASPVCPDSKTISLEGEVNEVQRSLAESRSVRGCALENKGLFLNTSREERIVWALENS